VEYLDMNGLPTRFFFQQAAFFCSNPEDREKMLEMASSLLENAASYLTYCKRERRTYFDVLQDFASCSIPFAYLIELIPPLRSRAFSISSSPSVHKNQVHITVAILQYLTPYKRLKTGTCSSFLMSLNGDGSRFVRGFFTSGSLRIPAQLDAPVILIGTGTGCAPMRSLMFERSIRTAQLDSRYVRFYFGCRNSKTDFLYEDEWPQLCDQVSVAFSKEEQRRVPVLLARDSQIIYNDLVTNRGYCYVSGSAKRMPADVRETLVQIFCKEGNLSRDDAVKMIRTMEKERRYVVEAWS
jgi:sulfite reductase alpha subunit-like flavoprotein